MPRRARRKQAEPGDAAGFGALVLGWLIYRQLSTLSLPWKIALAVLVTSIVGTGIVWAVRSARRRQKQHILLTNALSLTPQQFEKRIQYLLQDLGWERVEHVGGSGDGGVDLRAIYRGQRYIVQCKRYERRVEPKYLRDLEGARHHEHADRALLVTTGYFTQQGYAWVRGKPIDLWDGRVLAARFREQEIRLHDPERQRTGQRWTRWLLGGLAALNLLILLWATASAPLFLPLDQPVTYASGAVTAASDALPTIELPAIAPSPAAPESCGTATISGVERLVLRAAPGLQTEKLADFPAGTRVLLSCADAVTADGLIWQPVQIEGRTGWMSRRMLQMSR
ncbi:MAG TPA: restriction endonuclease [Herpetosiphonaceae bacterium]